MNDQVSSIGIKKLGDKATELLKKLFRQQAITEVSEQMKEAFCYNQGKIFRYAFLGGEFHKQFRLSANEREKKENYDCLYTFLNEEFKAITVENFELLKRMLKIEKKGDDPRVSLKMFRFVDKKWKIKTMFRDVGDMRYDDHIECEIGQNTASSKIVYSEDQYYLENDIPKAAKVGKYENPRLDLPRVHSYKEPSRFSSIFSSDRVDHSWIDCWNKINGASPPEKSCYKSTLCVPLTLRRNKLDKQFWDRFTEKAHKTELLSNEDRIRENAEKQVFGILGIDHTSARYFNHEFDVNIGFFFADLISVSYLIYLTYSDLSQTWRDYYTSHNSV